LTVKLHNIFEIRGIYRQKIRNNLTEKSLVRPASSSCGVKNTSWKTWKENLWTQQ